MQIQIHHNDVQSSEALEGHVREQVTHALGHWSGRVTRVEAHLHDDNGHKKGVDKRCVLEAKLAGAAPIAAEHVSDDLYASIKAAATKLKRAIEHKLERAESHR